MIMYKVSKRVVFLTGPTGIVIDEGSIWKVHALENEQYGIKDESHYFCATELQSNGLVKGIYLSVDGKVISRCTYHRSVWTPSSYILPPTSEELASAEKIINSVTQRSIVLEFSHHLNQYIKQDKVMQSSDLISLLRHYSSGHAEVKGRTLSLFDEECDVSTESSRRECRDRFVMHLQAELRKRLNLAV